MNTIPAFNRYTDTQLVAEVPRLVVAESRAIAIVVAALAEFDARRLYLPLGYPSLFKYCLDGLHLTEDATFTRLEAARAGRKYPLVFEMLHRGELSLTAVRMLAPHLTAANHTALLASARHQTKRQIEILIAKLKPQPPVPSVIRRLPVTTPTATTQSVAVEPPLSLGDLVATPPPVSRRAIVAPLSEAHYKLQVTISASARERLQQIQDLMRHRVPSGDPAAIVEHALEVLHAELLKKKAAEVARPRPGRADAGAQGRYIPASIKRAVFRRDRGACAFVSADGTKCGSTSGVEFHHVRPYAVGGEATVENIEMRCRAHNGFEWTRHLDAESASLARTQA